MNTHPNIPKTKWVIFQDFIQFTNDSRSLMSDRQPFLPIGYPVEHKTEGEVTIKQKFERKGPRLTFPEIDAHLERLLEIINDCIV